VPEALFQVEVGLLERGHLVARRLERECKAVERERERERVRERERESE
jgi:hypothetical protein